MRVFVAGATGAIGRPLVAQLLAAGHAVVGMTRAEDKAAWLRSVGAEAVVADVFDAPRVREAVVTAAPDALIHQLTDLPQHLSPRDVRAAYARNNRVRVEGTANLVRAAREAGVRRFLVQSMATWYAPGGEGLRTEDQPLFLRARPPVGAGVAAVADMERQVLSSGLDGIVLRYGLFHGPGTWLAPAGAMWTEMKRGRYPVLGRGEGLASWIHVEDAAAATVAALERGQPGIYNVVDDEPLPQRVWLPAYAKAIGGPEPRRVPVWLAALVIGRGMAEWQARMAGASNRKAREQLGIRPRRFLDALAGLIP